MRTGELETRRTVKTTIINHLMADFQMDFQLPYELEVNPRGLKDGQSRRPQFCQRQQAPPDNRGADSGV